MSKKMSFATIFTLLSLLIVFVISIAISVVFFYNLRSIMYRQVVTQTNVAMSRLQENIASSLKQFTDMIDSAAHGIAVFADHEIELTQENLDSYFDKMVRMIPDAHLLYFSSNEKWNAEGGYWVASPIWIPPEEWDQRGRPWFIDAKNAMGNTAFSEPYLDANTGDIAIAVSRVVYDKNGRDIGVVAIDISVLQLANMINSSLFYSGQKIHLLNKEGLYITHSDFNKIMEDDFFIDNQFQIFRNAILTSRENFFNEDHGEYIYAAPIPNADWFLVSIVSEAEVFKEVNNIIILTIGVVIGSMIFAALILVILTKRLVKPLKDMVSTLQAISKDWDLNKRLDAAKTKHIFEIDEITKVFNTTFDSIKDLVVNINKEVLTLSDIGNDLSINMNETAAAVNEITSNVRSIKTRVINQGTSVSETHSTMEKLVDNINKLDSHVENQSENISQASGAIEEMVSNINSVTNTLVNNAGNVRNLQAASEIGRNGLQEVSTDIQDIARESEGLLEINAVMENIASQTNLLSMNAAIEAAHAGEAGKGFAVVAGEIRKLAENSSRQSKTISDVLKKIKASIDKITSSTNNVLKNFEDINTGINIVVNQEDNIRNAMEEQGQGSKQILDGVSNINEITRQVKSSTNEMLDGTKEVIKESKNLNDSTHEITVSMNEMASGAEHINKAVKNVNEISSKNRNAIEVLAKEVSKFKV